LIEVGTLNKPEQEHFSPASMRLVRAGFAHIRLGSIVAISVLIDAVDVVGILRLGLKRVTSVVLEGTRRA
jgi:hypothetical protein